MKRIFRLLVLFPVLVPLLLPSCKKETGSSSGDSPAIKTVNYVQATLGASLPKKTWTAEDQLKAWSSAQAYKSNAVEVSKENPASARLSFDPQVNINLLGWPYDAVPDMSDGQFPVQIPAAQTTVEGDCDRTGDFYLGQVISGKAWMKPVYSTVSFLVLNDNVGRVTLGATGIAGNYKVKLKDGEVEPVAAGDADGIVLTGDFSKEKIYKMKIRPGEYRGLTLSLYNKATDKSVSCEVSDVLLLTAGQDYRMLGAAIPADKWDDGGGDTPDDPDDPEPGGQEQSVTVVLDNNLSKTAWTANDVIKGWTVTANLSSKAIRIDEQDGKQASFTFDTKDAIAFVGWPLAKAGNCSTDGFSVNLPSTRSAVAGAYDTSDDYFVGQVIDGAAHLKTFTSILSIQVKNDNVGSIALKAAGIAGASTVKMENGAIRSIAAGDASQVLLSGTIAKGQTYQVPVYPGNYTSFQLVFTNASNAKTYTATPAFNVSAGEVKLIFSDEISPAEWEDEPEEEEPQFVKFSGTSVKAGTSLASCVHVKGSFKDGDTPWVSVNGGAMEPCASEFISYDGTDLYIYTHRNRIGSTLRYYVKRGEKTYALTDPLQVLAPSLAEGYLASDELIDRLKACNADVASCFDVCDIVIPSKASGVNPFASVSYLTLTDLTLSSLSGIELFSAWSGSDWDKADVRMWNSNNLTDVDLSAWTAGVGIRLSSCDNLSSLIFGPNMYGGYIGGPVLHTIDCSRMAHLTHLKLDPGAPALTLLDLRTGNNIEGQDINLTPLASLTSPASLTIRIRSDWYLNHPVHNAWLNGVYTAWTAGATVQVYDAANPDNLLGTVPSYADNPSALPQGDAYVQGLNWHWDSSPSPGANYEKYSGTTCYPGQSRSLAIVINGTFQDGDTPYLSIDGGEKVLIGSNAVSYDASARKLYIFSKRDFIGHKLQYTFTRGGVSYDLTDKIDCIAPAISQGYVPDDNFLTAIKTARNWGSDLGGFGAASVVDEFDMVDPEKAAAVTCGNEDIQVTGQGFSSIEGIELFSGLGTLAWDMPIIRMWGNGELLKADLSNFNGYICFDFSSCPKLKEVIAGPNTGGFNNLSNCTSLETIDVSKSKYITNLQLNSNVPALKLLDIRYRPGGFDMKRAGYIDLRGLQSVSDYSQLTIRILKSYFDEGAAGTLQDQDRAWTGGIYYAYDHGATVEVYDDNDIDSKLNTYRK